MKREIISGIITAVFLLLTGSAFAGSATISWNANNDNDLYGYRIYYGTDKGGPYGSSTSLISKAQTRYTISDLTEGNYYFVVTAVDIAGNESAYSSEVSKTIASTTTSADPITQISGETSSGTTTTDTSMSSSGEADAAPTGTPFSPIPLPATGMYGKVNRNASQSQEVNFYFSGRAGKVKVYYQGYDVDSKKEISILINGRRIGYAKKTKNDKWGATRSITIKAKYVKNSGNNMLTFRNSSSTYKWGVRNISIK